MATMGLREDTVIAVGATAVAAIAWRYGGALRMTVIAKATFAFAEDAAMARVQAQEVFRTDEHHGRSPVRSVRFASDLAPYLSQGEVFFTGHAHAPRGGPIETMSVRLGIFDERRPLMDKTVILRQPGGFQKMPLVYERSFGGIGWAENPFGVAKPSILDPTDAKRLAGFGPIAVEWPARRRLLRETPRKALEGAIVEIPAGFDWGYFQAAPVDQRFGFLRGEEWIVMDGLHPTVPRMRMRLPGARGLARVYGLSAFGVTEGQSLSLHADMLSIDGDEQRCTVTFRGVFPVASEEALARVRVAAGVELPGEPVVWPDLAAAGVREVVSAGAEAELDETTILVNNDAPGPADGGVFAGTMMLDPEAAVTAALALPFQAGPAPEAITRSSGAGARARSESLTGTMAAAPAAMLEAAMLDSVTSPAPAPVAVPAPAPVLEVASAPVAPVRIGPPAVVGVGPAEARTFGAHFLAAMELIKEPSEDA